MKIIMYGAEICPDCVEAKKLLQNRTDIEFDYRNITENTLILKEFLKYRDHDSVFKSIIESGKIGIPFFVLEDGTKTFEITDIIDIEKSDLQKVINACSVDGSGNC